MARRSGNQWFLGSMTNWSPRELDVPLSFLGSGKYKAEIYEDAADAGQHPKNVRVHEETVDRSTHLKLKMTAAGGFAMRLVPVKD
jgi:alpha-glucosidase